MGFSKTELEARKAGIKDARKRAADIIRKHCVKARICTRCKNPGNEVAKGYMLCAKCSSYYKAYAQKARSKK
jgi:hypothetical protein